MKLYEFEAKAHLSRAGIPIPKGRVIDKKADLDGIDFYPVALKAQVLVGGRGKAGGIRFARDRAEAEHQLGALLEMHIKGFKVRRVLAEEKLDVASEIYMGIVLDRKGGLPLLIASAQGGMDIEDVPEDKLFRAHINPFIGLQPFVSRAMVYKLGLKEGGKELSDIARNLYRVFREMDSELAEINPLVRTRDGRLIAADAKLNIDDNSQFRHKDIKVDEDLKPLEMEAKGKGISFIQLDGNIGVIANGAGLTMATLDCLTNFNGRGGVFLDLGGTDDPEKVREAFVLVRKTSPKVIFLNIFGGITKCDTVALGIREALGKDKLDVPVVARIRGRNEEEGRKILSDAGFIATDDLEVAARKAAELGGG